MEEKSINKNYTLEAEILTPVHVGAGAEKDWLKNADYIFDNGKVYLLDHQKVIDAIGPDKYAHALTAPKESSLKDMLPEPVKDYALKVLECDTASNNEIRAQVRAGLENKPVIPGSSMKGALRSVIMHHLGPSKTTHKNDFLNKKIMGSPNEGDEFGRFFKVTDVSFEETKLTNTKIWNLNGQHSQFNSGWKHFPKNGTKPSFNPKGFNTIYEYIPVGEKSFLQFSIASKPFENLKKKNLYHKQNKLQAKEKLMTRQIEFLFKVINDYTLNYLEKEIKFFDDHRQAEHTDKILDNLTALKSLIPSDNSYCIMRLAAGSGFHSITGDWKLESHDIDKIVPKGRSSQGMLGNEKSAKSRKIAVSGGHFMPMGFIKLRQVTEAEIKAREELERQKCEEARKQKEMEAKRREEERIREQKIQKLLGEAENLLAKEQFSDASEKLDEAAETSPGDNRLDEKREAIENARKVYEERLLEEEHQTAFEEKQRKKAEDLKKRQEANKAEQEKEQKQILGEGLAKLAEIQDFNKGREFIESYFRLNQNKIPEKEKTHLKDFVRRMKQRKPKDWKKANRGKWKLVTKWIGKEETQQWFEELK